MAYGDTPFPLDRSDALAFGVAVVVAFVASLLYAALGAHPLASVFNTWAWLGVSAVALYLFWRLVRAVERFVDSIE